jgi:hypothetical protein
MSWRGCPSHCNHHVIFGEPADTDRRRGGATLRQSGGRRGGLLYPLEHRHQELLNALPDAGILRLPISGDVEALDLWVPAEPLDHVRRKDDFARCNEHQELMKTLAGFKGRLGAWRVCAAEPERSITVLDILHCPGRLALGRHLASTVDVRDPALWTLFGQESKRHPPAHWDAARLCRSPSGLVGASLSA